MIFVRISAPLPALDVVGDVAAAPSGISESHHSPTSIEESLLHSPPLVDGRLRVAVRFSKHRQVRPVGEL